MALKCAKGITQISQSIRYAFFLFCFELWQFVCHLSGCLCCCFCSVYVVCLCVPHFRKHFHFIIKKWRCLFSSDFQLILLNSLIYPQPLEQEYFVIKTYWNRLRHCDCLLNALNLILFQHVTKKLSTAINTWDEFKITVKYVRMIDCAH